VFADVARKGFVLAIPTEIGGASKGNPELAKLPIRSNSTCSLMLENLLGGLKGQPSYQITAAKPTADGHRQWVLMERRTNREIGRFRLERESFQFRWSAGPVDLRHHVLTIKVDNEEIKCAVFAPREVEPAALRDDGATVPVAELAPLSSANADVRIEVTVTDGVEQQAEKLRIGGAARIPLPGQAGGDVQPSLLLVAEARTKPAEIRFSIAVSLDTIAKEVTDLYASYGQMSANAKRQGDQIERPIRFLRVPVERLRNATRGTSLDLKDFKEFAGDVKDVRTKVRGLDEPLRKRLDAVRAGKPNQKRRGKDANDAFDPDRDARKLDNAKQVLQDLSDEQDRMEQAAERLLEAVSAVEALSASVKKTIKAQVRVIAEADGFDIEIVRNRIDSAKDGAKVSKP
jgi:hypothetical protein